MKKAIGWIIGVGAFVAIMLTTVIMFYLRGLMDPMLSQLIFAASLVVVTYAYGSLAVLSILDARERNVRPVVSLDLVVFGDDTLPGYGIRIRNCGYGPALDIVLEVLAEPTNPAFRMSSLPALKEGIPVLDKEESRVISGGQPYSTLSQMDDGFYRVRVRYSSITKQLYRTVFTLRPQRDLHLLRSTIPKVPLTS